MLVLIIFIMSIFYSLLFTFSLLQVFFSLFPIHRHNKIFISLRCIYFKQCIRLFRIITGEKEPAVAWAFTGVTQIKVDTRQQYLESNGHITILRIYFDKTNCAFKILFISINSNISI